ncbi:putative hydro-lyase [Rivularia sp. UHCC 0363]|uniref:putative hydro-lyase n=1 Tax=Rivularia sp. UHCC 0363 TaxID=3110244 RepID=UPI002B21F86B|nr:putative hydro-lyase [Rivularia sp. UHCC 0363]MEA5593773.1 putative hydro-lyase [Rivularia sp. UHCC 0363]
MDLSPAEVRYQCRQGTFHFPTSGISSGFLQANLVILPRNVAFDFLVFCTRNPKPCPLLDVTEVGNPEPEIVSPGADLRTDLPRYHIFRDGKLKDEVANISDIWQDDFVGFLIGCSFSFEAALMNAGIPVRHIQEGKNVPMYKTNIPCRTAGGFSAPMVVSMRPLSPSDVIRAVQITSRFPKAHGTPIHFGSPEEIGIKNLDAPDFGEAVTIAEGEVPVFWACGVTTQIAILQAKPEIAITHAPGYMFVTDIKDDYFAW